MPAACAVDHPRREVVEQELALVVLVEEDGRACDLHTAVEFGGDVGDAVYAHGFCFGYHLASGFFSGRNSRASAPVDKKKLAPRRLDLEREQVLRRHLYVQPSADFVKFRERPRELRARRLLEGKTNNFFPVETRREVSRPHSITRTKARHGPAFDSIRRRLERTDLCPNEYLEPLPVLLGHRAPMSRIDSKQCEHFSARRCRGRRLLKMRHEEVPPEDARAPRVFQHIAEHKRARAWAQSAAEQGAPGFEQQNRIPRRPFVLQSHDTKPHTFRGLAAHVVERQLAESWHVFFLLLGVRFFFWPGKTRGRSCAAQRLGAAVRAPLSVWGQVTRGRSCAAGASGRGASGGK